MISRLRELGKELELSPIHKILLTTDGSITRILEAVSGEEVEVVTEKQEVISASLEVAADLSIRDGEEVNYRVVNLKNSKGVLAHAVSYAPLHRLKKDFREDMMRKDMPIGRIMSELQMEARREIKSFQAVESNKRLSTIFGIPEHSTLLKRQYHIIHGGETLISITEFFPYKV
ncbi:MAG: chorismate pyruvate-lyase family protein [Candidatus Hydrothermarchaeales archaeon]